MLWTSSSFRRAEYSAVNPGSDSDKPSAVFSVSVPFWQTQLNCGSPLRLRHCCVCDVRSVHSSEYSSAHATQTQNTMSAAVGHSKRKRTASDDEDEFGTILQSSRRVSSRAQNRKKPSYSELSDDDEEQEEAASSLHRSGNAEEMEDETEDKVSTGDEDQDADADDGGRSSSRKRRPRLTETEKTARALQKEMKRQRREQKREANRIAKEAAQDQKIRVRNMRELNKRVAAAKAEVLTESENDEMGDLHSVHAHVHGMQQDWESFISSVLSLTCLDPDDAEKADEAANKLLLNIVATFRSDLARQRIALWLQQCAPQHAAKVAAIQKKFDELSTESERLVFRYRQLGREVKAALHHRVYTTVRAHVQPLWTTFKTERTQELIHKLLSASCDHVLFIARMALQSCRILTHRVQDRRQRILFLVHQLPVMFQHAHVSASTLPFEQFEWCCRVVCRLEWFISLAACAINEELRGEEGDDATFQARTDKDQSVIHSIRNQLSEMLVAHAAAAGTPVDLPEANSFLPHEDDAGYQAPPAVVPDFDLVD